MLLNQVLHHPHLMTVLDEGSAFLRVLHASTRNHKANTCIACKMRPPTTAISVALMRSPVASYGDSANGSRGAGHKARWAFAFRTRHCLAAKKAWPQNWVFFVCHTPYVEIGASPNAVFSVPRNRRVLALYLETHGLRADPNTAVAMCQLPRLCGVAGGA